MPLEPCEHGSSTPGHCMWCLARATGFEEANLRMLFATRQDDADHPGEPHPPEETRHETPAP